MAITEYVRRRTTEDYAALVNEIKALRPLYDSVVYELTQELYPEVVRLLHECIFGVPKEAKAMENVNINGKTVYLGADAKVESDIIAAIDTGEAFEMGTTKIVDLRKFHAFVTSKVKAGSIDFVAYINELITEAGYGYGRYEIESSETKSGNPETISFKYDFEYDEEADVFTSETIEFY